MCETVMEMRCNGNKEFLIYFLFLLNCALQLNMPKTFKNMLILFIFSFRVDESKTFLHTDIDVFYFNLKIMGIFIKVTII